MPHQRTVNRSRRSPTPRVVRRYRTCAEAFRAVAELERLAEDELSDLRERGREVEADRRADAWNREIARALGEAQALLRVVADSPQASAPSRRSKIDRIGLLTGCGPSRVLAIAAVVLVGMVVLAWAIERLASELLAAAAIAASLSFVCRSHRSHRKRTGHGS